MLRTAEGAQSPNCPKRWAGCPIQPAVLTGLRKRGYAERLDRSDAERGSAYRIAVDANDAHAGTAPTSVRIVFGRPD